MSIFAALATKEQKLEKQRHDAERKRQQHRDDIRRDIAALVEDKPHDEKRLADEYHTVADLEADCDSYRNCKAKHELQAQLDEFEAELAETKRTIRDLQQQIRSDLGTARNPPLIKAREAAWRNLLAKKSSVVHLELEDFTAWRDAMREVEDIQDQVHFLEFVERRLSGQIYKVSEKIKPIDATFDQSSGLPSPMNFALSRL